jgi:hypothetical protein
LVFFEGLVSFLRMSEGWAEGVTIPDECFLAHVDYQRVRASLEGVGFEGFLAVQQLNENNYEGIPKKPGVYVLLRRGIGPRTFCTPSKAGWHKGKDPTIDLTELGERWVEGVSVVYIGKAGKEGSNATLRQRLRAYLRSGLGHSAGHWGGRAVWQLADQAELIFAWRSTPAADAPKLESELLLHFHRLHDKLPFANRRR